MTQDMDLLAAYRAGQCGQVRATLVSLCKEEIPEDLKNVAIAVADEFVDRSIEI